MSVIRLHEYRASAFPVITRIVIFRPKVSGKSVVRGLNTTRPLATEPDLECLRTKLSDRVYVNMFTRVQADAWSIDAARSLTTPNAGGNSVVSEAYSIHMLQNYFGFTSIILETEVKYWIQYKLVDYIGTFRGRRVGVSVTRAMTASWRTGSTDFSVANAEHLLEKKLYGLVVSRRCVDPEQSFRVCLLHIFCQSMAVVDAVRTAFQKLRDHPSFGETIFPEVNVLFTITGDEAVYSDYF